MVWTCSGFPRSGKNGKKKSKSGNFGLSQGKLKFWQKSGKSQGILELKVEDGEAGYKRNEKLTKCLWQFLGTFFSLVTKKAYIIFRKALFIFLKFFYNQKAFIFGPWLPWRASIHIMTPGFLPLGGA